ncbi:MAG: 50S ribosomal protein L24e [Nitrososphaerota archaeon]|nr:50S ribosomal protein L24e [Nitrososphaerota archaeon]
MSYISKKCSFCGRSIALGMGIMYVRNDAATFWYCSSKCRKNSSKLKRDPRKLKWSRATTKVKGPKPEAAAVSKGKA